MPPPRFWIADIPLGRLGNVEVSKFETATGARLRLRRAEPRPMEAYLDPLELEGLTRVRYRPMAILPARDDAPRRAEERAESAEGMERLQNEFALVDVRVAGGAGTLFIRDMNAGQAVALTSEEVESLLRARHRDFAPLVDTSDLVAVPEPDIDQT